MKKILGLALYGELAASTRYRMSQYKKVLASAGYQLDIQPLLSDKYLGARFSGEKLPVLHIVNAVLHRGFLLATTKKYDAIMLYGELIPFCPSFIEKMLLGLPYLYDFDDAFYLKYSRLSNSLASRFLSEKINICLSNASVITAGNNTLYRHASNLNNKAYYLPTVVDLDRYTPRKTEPNDDVFVIGWLGSPSTAVYLRPLVPVLKALAKKRSIKFVVVGGNAPAIDGVVVEQHNWSESSELELIKSFHVGIMPLTDDDWARGKCAFKLIQYMACAVPVVADAVGANTRLVTADCGFLVDSQKGWYEALYSLATNNALRNDMGLSSRQRIEKEYSLQVHAATLVKAFDILTGQRGAASCVE